ncbi:MAG TPA: DUF1028 domain-containing protein [Falsiroseomonas sp.]|jgi:uncharacterized Ntn-hydrolase superfamily protein|nr:DUF1028 domain-containing protein [Falsiroseomonas sp.]
MTYTLIGRCGRTGALGIGVATYSLVVGGLCPVVISGCGALASQAFVNPTLKTLGARLLRAGHPASQVLALLRDADPHAAFRQVAVLDRRGDGACHTGQHCRDWAGHVAGPDFIACGNVLRDGGVARAMAEAFLATPEAALGERLLRALEAGRDAGGQMGGAGHLPERSASLLVHEAAEEHALLDLRIDRHADAVAELRLLYDDFRPYLAFHALRWRNPAEAPPQERFVASLR